MTEKQAKKKLNALLETYIKDIVDAQKGLEDLIEKSPADSFAELLLRTFSLKMDSVLDNFLLSQKELNIKTK